MKERAHTAQHLDKAGHKILKLVHNQGSSQCGAWPVACLVGRASGYTQLNIASSFAH